MQRFAWSHGSFAVRREAGMLHDLAFALGERSFRPLARAPWAAETCDTEGLTGHMRWLGGEFVCLPFGVGGTVESVAPDWRELPLGAANDPPHGFPANAVWEVCEAAAGSVTLRLDLPPPGPLARLTRRITGIAGEATLALELTVEARRPARLPLGLHPILRLDGPPGSLALGADFAFGLTYPAAVPGGAMVAAIGAEFASLDRVPGRDGTAIDLSRLPLGRPVEDVVQLCGVASPVTIRFEAERAGLSVDWDRTILPSCQLWISDRALSTAPWCGRFSGLGIEPIASAFDFAESVSTAANPISRRGIATTVALCPDAPLTIGYRLSALCL
jgi:hypothetical protein